MWSKHDYLLEVKSELNNTRVYEKWCGNPFQNVNAKTKSDKNYHILGVEVGKIEQFLKKKR